MSLDRIKFRHLLERQDVVNFIQVAQRVPETSEIRIFGSATENPEHDDIDILVIRRQDVWTKMRHPGPLSGTPLHIITVPPEMIHDSRTPVGEFLLNLYNNGVIVYPEEGSLVSMRMDS